MNDDVEQRAAKASSGRRLCNRSSTPTSNGDASITVTLRDERHAKSRSSVSTCNLSVPVRRCSISIPHKTFRHAENGSDGLARGRKVVVAYASGGFHRGPEEDFVDRYPRAFFRLLGIKDIDVVLAEGVDMSEDHRAPAMQAARVEIGGIAARIR